VADSWWLALLSGLAWLVLSGIVLRLATGQAAIVLMAAVFLLSASGQFLDRARYGFPPDRKLAGHAVAAALALLLTLVLVGLRDRLSPAAAVLAFLLAVIAVALAGGLIPAVIEAVAGSLLLHVLVTPQPGKSAIAAVSDAAVLGVLVVLAVVVGLLAEEVARRGRQAAFAAKAVRLAAEAVTRDEDDR
jgi:two-component system sensor histidine kinase KdpD